MAYFGEFWGAKFKVFFIVSSLSGVWVDSVANFGFVSKTMNKKTSLNAVIGRGRLILVCYIRTYVIILVGIFPLTSPPTKILEGMCPRHPRRRWRQWLTGDMVIKCTHVTATTTEAMIHNTYSALVRSQTCSKNWLIAYNTADKYYMLLCFIHYSTSGAAGPNVSLHPILRSGKLERWYFH